MKEHKKKTFLVVKDYNKTNSEMDVPNSGGGTNALKYGDVEGEANPCDATPTANILGQNLHTHTVHTN